MHYRYTENIKLISKLYHDQPLKAKDAVVYWVEYLVRNNGAPHFKSAAQDLNFIEYYMIDVFITIFIGIVLIMYLVMKCTFKVIACLRKKCTKEDLSKKEK